ncbi:small ubiquitin-related modifier [Enteropsectra breve]|nr:small ubiquitin-related modifier [Enteropsectra breve]
MSDSGNSYNYDQGRPDAKDANSMTTGSDKQEEQVKLVLQGSSDNKTVVLAKPSTKISKLLKAYCRERNISPQEYRLVYKGKVLQEDGDVSIYNIKDNDVIDVVASQVGGCF